jgi:uncharacterized protein YjiS (DUF1127 family)
MIMAHRSNTHTFSSFPTHPMALPIGILVEGIGAALRRHQDRRSLRELMTFSDHELKDIGVSRADVHREIDKTRKWW